MKIVFPTNHILNLLNTVLSDTDAIEPPRVFGRTVHADGQADSVPPAVRARRVR